ncbi:MAG: adenosylmethionine--8-amino-7-oxononanoate transaminase [Bacteroidota bacterium]|nr:adenosylmethionine--8-amino-7-oxononanoate transaminase [Bacteroidota bacterium]
MNLEEKDKAYIWHPFTQMKGAATPIHIERGEGSYLYSADGKKYIDAVSSWWVNIHGHANPYIAESIYKQSKQLEHVIFAGFTHTPAILLAEKLLQILPAHFSKVFYSDNGSTSVEVAIKMALQYWYNKGVKHKTKIIALENAYHGDTFGAMSVGERNTFNAPFDLLLFEVYHIPIPTENNIDICIQKLHKLASQNNIAAFIVEPLVQGAAGMQMYHPDELDLLIHIAQKHDILCIVDEVMTGFGRTGKNFAIEHIAAQPDIICLSKGITGGFMPLAVTICTEEIYQAFYDDEQSKAFFHGHSYTANPLSCAAALASIELLLSEICQQQISFIYNSHLAFSNRIRRNKSVKDVRVTGTIIAVELNTTDDSSYFNSIRTSIYDFCLSKGVLLRPLGNIIYIMPPYCITHKELEIIYNTIEEVIVHHQSQLINVTQQTQLATN